jgi:hypothetical protein
MRFEQVELRPDDLDAELATLTGQDLALAGARDDTVHGADLRSSDEQAEVLGHWATSSA